MNVSWCELTNYYYYYYYLIHIRYKTRGGVFFNQPLGIGLITARFTDVSSRLAPTFTRLAGSWRTGTSRTRTRTPESCSCQTDLPFSWFRLPLPAFRYRIHPLPTNKCPGLVLYFHHFHARRDRRESSLPRFPRLNHLAAISQSCNLCTPRPLMTATATEKKK